MLVIGQKLQPRFSQSKPAIVFLAPVIIHFLNQPTAPRIGYSIMRIPLQDKVVEIQETHVYKNSRGMQMAHLTLVFL